MFNSSNAGRYQLVHISLQDFHAGCNDIQAVTIALVLTNQSVNQYVQTVSVLVVFHNLVPDILDFATTIILALVFVIHAIYTQDHGIELQG
jgi:hypothetical protein